MHPDRIKLILKIVAPVTLTSLFFLTLVFQFTSSVEAAGIIFVDGLVSGGSDDGSDWANAYIDLQSALAVATSGDEIWVATGVYTPGTSATDTFQLLDGVAIYGGFAATETARSQRDWEANLTVLSGDIDSDDTADSNGIVTDTANITGTNTYHIVTGDGVTTTAVLDGFTITAGNALGVNCSNNGCGGGMYNSDGSPSLTNLIFSANHAQFWGGGIYNESSYSTFTNVTFYANSTEEDSGGGMHNSSGLVTLNQVVFNNNSAGWNGGGAMFNGGTDAILNNVAFIGNSVPGDGGAILNSSSDIIMTNVMFSANSAQNGGGIFNVSSHPTLLNVTFSGNSATGRGGGMDSILGSRPAITNTIFWGNDAPENPNMRSASGSVPTVSYSLIEGSGGSSSWDSSFGTDAGNNIDSDPFFTFSITASQSPTLTANLQLMIDSPAINSGRDASYDGLYDTDLAGNNRVENETIDMGAYETLFASLLVTNAGSGEGRVSSDSADINCGITCTVRAELDTTITLTAATETGSTFSGWSGSVSSLSNPI
ncbi:MAG: choice-of-anchor Q domain-containing protein, partial [Chloroflexota bacterium]